MSLAKQGMDKLRNIPVVLEIDGFTAMILISQIQLALRHPRNDGPSSEIARELAIHMQSKITGIDASVDLALQMGWNPDYDV